jgi:hypothetical protein
VSILLVDPVGTPVVLMIPLPADAGPAAKEKAPRSNPNTAIPPNIFLK